MQRPQSVLQARPPSRAGASTRALMFVLWAGVLWGTLLDLVALWMLVTTGPRAAWQNLQGLSADGHIFGYLNVLLAVLAIFVWLTVGWTLTLGSKEGR